ncbi:MAG: dynamin family protein [Prevotella sp.]|jgi:GTPase Era involved in 16S rRNA processing|nr:dynamin family protein [Prevotella sp.]
MGNQFLEMYYHPARKEVLFRRYQEGKEVPIAKDSKLSVYMNKKGKFVLQDHGNSFFNDIAKVFDGMKAVEIQAVTTKIDFEDFEQMVEYFNNESGNKCRITATLLSELSDMNAVYDEVKKHGIDSMDILKRHRSRFFDVPQTCENVKKFIENFSADVQGEIDSIKQKIESMGDNSVNLCFTGVYSAGKSALINAMLGYKILPEKITSETARMFVLQSPKKSEKVRIIFAIRADYVELVWNDRVKVFEFHAGPTESPSRTKIQEKINNNKSAPLYRQLYEILTTLNGDDNISSDIKVYFPIPLDTDNVQFTIYDTPGTDSNFGEHQSVLEDALSEQTHSILVFVAAPNKTEGEGNNALLSYLKNAEQKDSKTSIDIGRSLFVINLADSITNNDRKDLQNAEIKAKDDEAFSIKLSNKKLFFTSALYGYAAKATANNIATDNEKYMITDDHNKVYRPERGRYYLQNRCATSEYATKKLIEKSEVALKHAEEKNDVAEVFHVCSGLYALEEEIKTYGERYAVAVRAFAIIDSVEKAVAKMTETTASLESQAQADIDKIDSEIAELKETIENAIEEAREKYAIPQDGLPGDTLKILRLDENVMNINIIGKVLSFINEKLKGWFFGAGKVNFKKEHQNEIGQKIKSILTDWSGDFSKEREKLLEAGRDNFIADVQDVIRHNGDLSDEAKEFVCNIRPPEIKLAHNISEIFAWVFDENKYTGKFLFWDREFIDKDGVLKNTEFELAKIAAVTREGYTKDYRNTLEGILSEIRTEFTQNVEKYSVLLKAKLEDKRSMDLLYEKIAAAAKDLESSQQELNGAIWRTKNHEQ